MSTLSDLKPGIWNVDASHSEVGFTARHLMVSKVRGQFKDFAAVVTVAQPFELSSVEATVQMASVDTNSADRDTHVKSADFFDVETNPVMTFKSTKVTDDTLEGLLTIKGTTNPVTFDLEFGGVSADPWGGTRAGLEATTEINRKDFGLSWNVAVEGGGVLVGEKVKLTLDVQLVQTADVPA
ncbi:MAG TPA: YceI family protein [Dermatophilaceae bacterium]|nr:YceI family protein [Dermatophilaceae bacterium]